ncbi:MAG: 4Fe-4S dicluster domain-containing protein [Proteobacteria bacterium]|nr:4Fe-4S dicluster domain-containing protein [Pseudomonadota bacterium]
MRENPHLIAVVDRSRCEARGPCTSACPTKAIKVRRVSDDVRADLGRLARLKLWMHGGDQAFIDPDACLGCAACVQVCPENALGMRKR